jgi:alpha-L-rhamnosidase
MRLTAALLLLCTLSSAAEFRSGKPVWPEGMEREKNLFVGFRAVLPPAAEPLVLRVTGCTVYRIFVNGEFRGYGPARA